LANDGEGLPRQEVKANAVHDFISLRIPAKANTQVCYGKQWGGHAALLWVRGSRMSRSASPVRLKPKMPSMMVTAGKIISQGACCIRFLLSASITPSEGVGGWVPRPRNDRPASVSSAHASANVTCTASGATRLSNKWRL